jgi:hypothetical protein
VAFPSARVSTLPEAQQFEDRTLRTDATSILRKTSFDFVLEDMEALLELIQDDSTDGFNIFKRLRLTAGRRQRNGLKSV